MIRAVFFLLLGMGALWSGTAHASGDYSCTPSWTLHYASLSGCDDLAMLGPRNDSRSNLVMLLADLPGAPPIPAAAAPSVFLDVTAWLPRSADGGSPFFSDGEGSRCRSNEAGAARFEAAIRANAKVPDAERTALIAARRGLQPDCAGGTAGSPSRVAAVGGVTSAAGKVFAAYLDGAAAFYAGDFDAATARFAALGSARDPWLRETARYMLGRIAVNRAQVDYYDDYGAPKEGMKIAPKLLADAENALRDYMKAYPEGEYFFSARGLLRRVYWLAQDHAKLEAEYAALIALPAAQRGIDTVTLAQEIDAKLLASATADTLHDPILLAAFDLMHMRTSNDGGAPCCAPLSRAALDAQRPKFAARPALFAFLQATHAYHVDAQPREALRLLPDASHQADFSYLEFSRQMLRGMALEDGADRNVRGFWIDLLSGAKAVGQRPVVELALAMHDERHDALARIFAPDSLVRSQEIRDILLMNVADAQLLRQQAQAPNTSAHERNLALFTLLYKEATRGSHRAFVEDTRLIPAGASTEAAYYDLHASEPLPTGLFVKGTKLGDVGCPALVETQRRLAAAPADPKAMLCLGDFVRVNDFDGFFLDAQPPADELGGTPSRFAGTPYARLQTYQAVIASPVAGPDEKAYALFRAVNCYAPSGYNACGGKGVEIATRKGWFQRLKRDYPQSRWAQALRYYW